LWIYKLYFRLPIELAVCPTCSPALLYYKFKFHTSKILAKHVDMVGKHGMRAEFWIGKLFVNALLDDHGNDGRALR